MGPVCSAQKRKTKTQEQKEEFRSTNQPCLDVTSLAGQSLPLELKNQSNIEEAVQDLMKLFKRFTMFLDLVGNLAQLPQHTRDKLNNCIVIKQNISIIIQNNVKRVMREQQIIKRIDESDYYLIFNDRKFASTFNSMMSKLSNVILTELKPDEDFQSAFPILAVSFEEEAEKIIDKYIYLIIIMQLKSLKTIQIFLQEKEVPSIHSQLTNNYQLEKLHNNEIIQLFIFSFTLFLYIWFYLVNYYKNSNNIFLILPSQYQRLKFNTKTIDRNHTNLNKIENETVSLKLTIYISSSFFYHIENIINK